MSKKEKAELNFTGSFRTTAGGDYVFTATATEMLEKIRDGEFANDVKICFGGQMAKSASAILDRSDCVVVALNVKEGCGKLREMLTRLPFVAGVFRGGNGELIAVVCGKEAGESFPSRDARLFVDWLSAIYGERVFGEYCAVVAGTHDPECFINPQPLAFNPSSAFRFSPLEDLLGVWGRVLEPIWNVGKDYTIHNAADEEYPIVNETQAWRPLLVSGFPKERKDEVMNWLREKKSLAAVFKGFVGYNGGIHVIDGSRVAVAKSPNWVESFSMFENGRPLRLEDIEPCCATSLRILRSRFDDPNEPRQFATLIAWIQRARKRIKHFLTEHDAGRDVVDELYNCPMLCIMGSVSAGKTRLVKNIITPLLGGRCCDAKKELATGERFNGDLLSNEILLVDDISPTDVAEKGRSHFAQNIKSYLYGDGAAIEAKHANKVSVKNPCYVAIQLFNANAIESTPDPNDCRDKTLFINADIFAPIDEDKREALWAGTNEMIRDERPWLATWIDNYKVPADVDAGEYAEDCEKFEYRNGIRFFCATACLDVLNSVDYGYALIERFDNNLSKINYYDRGKYYDCELSPTKILEVLQFDNSKGLPNVVKIGLRFKELSITNGDRVKCVKQRSGNVNRYIITRPKGTEGDNDEF